MTMRELEGARVMVTGAAAGAGAEIARQFLGAGARVAVCDIDAQAVTTMSAATPAILGQVCDVGDDAAVDRLFVWLVARFGGLDVLVNNVGIAGPTAKAEDVTADDWEHTLRVNVGSHFYCCRRAIPLMKQAGGGAIINISSTSARTGLPLRLPYLVSKAAVLSLTSNLARELGPSGIRVNAILPGGMRGERLQKVIGAKAAALGVTPAEYESELVRFISLRTLVEPTDIAAMAVFLASPAARFVTGQQIGVCGNVEYEA